MSAAVVERIDDDLWSAIGDPTRRRILDLLLADGDGTATSLSGQLPVTRQAVAKQLSTLEEAGYVRVERPASGRRRRVQVRLTTAGHTAFRGHVAALQAIVGTATSNGAPARRG